MARPIDRTRFEALVEAHHAAVYRSAHRVVRAAAAAQDVAQEVFLRVLDGRLDVAALAADEARPVLCHWAVRIAWNTRRGEARRAAREERHAMERRDESPAPRDDDDQRLWQLVDGLADELRVPLLLRFVEGVTFAKIGEALGIGESAAHERVGKALGRVRQRLGDVRLGDVRLGAFAIGLAQEPAQMPELERLLSERLPRAAALDPAAAVPAGLTARLLGLQAGAAAVHGGLALGLLCAAAGLVGAAFLARRPDTAPPRPDGAHLSADGATAIATADTSTSRETLAVPGASARLALAADSGSGDSHPSEDQGTADIAARALYGMVHGRVVDADGAPLADVDVAVDSVERDGKFATYSAGARTDANGRFRATVELAAADGGRYTVRVVASDRTDRGALERRLRPGDEVDVGDLVAAPWDAASDLEGVRVGPTETRATGLVSGRLLVVAGLVDRPIPEQLSVHVRLAPHGSWHLGEVLTDGTFTVGDLPVGKHRVHVMPTYHHRRDGDEASYSPTWFDVELREGALESRGHDVELKRDDDPRDVGHHAAEVHGRVVARDTQAAVEVSCWAVELDLAPAPGVDFADDWLPNHLVPAPVQRMIAGPIPSPSAEFHLTGQDGGLYVLRCHEAGHAPFVSPPFDLGEREVRADVLVALEAPCRVAGRVLDPSGAPVDGAWVLVTGVGPYSDARIAEADHEVRAADGRGTLHLNGTEERTKVGEFVLAGLPSGVGLRLVALHPDYTPVFGPRFELAVGEARRGDTLRFATRAPR